MYVSRKFAYTCNIGSWQCTTLMNTAIAWYRLQIIKVQWMVFNDFMPFPLMLATITLLNERPE
jgi:hypothetical protein